MSQDKLSANTDALRGVGGAQMGMGGTLTAVGTAVQVFPCAALAPVFGLIGAHYLGAFAAATAKQALSIGTLGTSVIESGVSTTVAGGAYDDAENNVSGMIGATGDGLES